MNRLSREKSSYLRQHASNPVDWYPWGIEAFNAAQEQNKPIFLSIGYATCHWCHVMERESFECVETAKLLNETFINIKVDREELPAVDSLYMEFAQSMITGSAGWPLNLVLTPQLKPFFACTYLPRTKRRGLIGVQELAKRIGHIWGGDEREFAIEQANSICDIFKEIQLEPGDAVPSHQLVDQTIDLLYRISDPVYGGLKGAPKFPLACQQTFLINYSMRTGDPKALFIAERTLERMYQGGIYDHLDGGFARYSIDEKWLVPHFEKMLYDNALLLEAYARAHLATGSELYKKIAFETARYILNVMTEDGGGFYSAEDSENEGQEGLFYTWLYTDVIQALGDEHEEFCDYYNITPEGNFEGRNILNVPKISDKDFTVSIALLRKVRETSPRPFKDTKILSAWNGLTIHSMAYAGVLLDEEKILQAAVKTAEFFYNQENLNRRYIDGIGAFPPTLEDYAFLVRAFITLFEAGCGSKWLRKALELTKTIEEEFKEYGRAFYQTRKGDDELIIRSMQYSDGAEPSGNAIHTENLLRLYQMTLDKHFLMQAEDVLRGVHKLLSSYGAGYLYHLLNLDWYHDSNAQTLVIVTDDSPTPELKKILRETYNPHRVVIWKSPDDKILDELLPFTKKQTLLENNPTFYLCKNGVCSNPTTDLSQLKKALYNRLN